MSLDAFLKYGDPLTETSMFLYNVPRNLQVGKIPKRVYCNRDLVEPLAKAFKNLIDRKLVAELESWDGCFNIRPIRGFEKPYNVFKAKEDVKQYQYLSKHAWGLAIDVNASKNRLGQTPTLTKSFVECFTDAGFVWGGNFKRKDGMHFEI